MRGGLRECQPRGEGRAPGEGGAGRPGAQEEWGYRGPPRRVVACYFIKNLRYLERESVGLVKDPKRRECFKF